MEESWASRGNRALCAGNGCNLSAIAASNRVRKEQPMKIAAVTADGTAIHSHFGQAPYFEVLTIENGAVTAREQRAKQ